MDADALRRIPWWLVHWLCSCPFEWGQEHSGKTTVHTEARLHRRKQDFLLIPHDRTVEGKVRSVRGSREYDRAHCKRFLAVGNYCTIWQLHGADEYVHSLFNVPGNPCGFGYCDASQGCNPCSNFKSSPHRSENTAYDRAHLVRPSTPGTCLNIVRWLQLRLATRFHRVVEL